MATDLDCEALAARATPRVSEPPPAPGQQPAKHYLQPVDATSLPSWRALQKHRLAMQRFNMREAFEADAERFNGFSTSSCGLFLDYSKNLITHETRDLLLQLARESGLGEAIQAMFAGELVNASERRPALHTALRRPPSDAEDFLNTVH